MNKKFIINAYNGANEFLSRFKQDEIEIEILATTETKALEKCKKITNRQTYEIKKILI